MKKIISLISAMSIASMLVACGGTEAGSVPSLPNEQISEQASVVVSSESIVSSSLELEENGYLSTGPFYAGYYSDEMIELTVGDTYNGLTLTNLQYQPEGKTISENSEGLTIFYPPDESATMEGEITLRGTLTTTEEYGDIPTFVWIVLDEESANKIAYPKLVRESSEGDKSLLEPLIYLGREGGEKQAPENALNSSGWDILADITNLKEANGVPCEITISEISFVYVWDIKTYVRATLIDFKQL